MKKKTKEKSKTKVKPLFPKQQCDLCGASFIMGKPKCVGCGHEFPK